MNRHRNLGCPVFRSLLHIDDIINGIIRNTGRHTCRHSVGDGYFAHQIGHDRVHGTFHTDVAIGRRRISRFGFNGYTLPHIDAGINVSSQPAKHALNAHFARHACAKGDIRQHRFIVCLDEDTVSCRPGSRCRRSCIAGNRRIVADIDFAGRAGFHNAYGTADGVGPGGIGTHGNHLFNQIQTPLFCIFTY